MQFNEALALLLAVLLLGITGRTSALGTNCKGSSLCKFSSSHTLSQINTQVQAIPGGTIYSNGDHITCAGGAGHICAFFQNIAGTQTAAQVQSYIQTLMQFGCQICGSVALNGVNVDFGELTVNYVEFP